MDIFKNDEVEDDLSSQQKVSVGSVFLLIPWKDRRLLYFGMFLRVLINLFDLVALSGVALLALVISNLGASTESGVKVAVPIVGYIYITEQATVLISLGIASMFLLKSISAIILNEWIGARIAKIESHAANRILNHIFGPNQGIRAISSVSELQNILTVSLNSLFSNLITATVTLWAELSLLLILVAGFMIVSPIGTIGMVAYLALVVLGLNFFVSRKVRKEAAIGFVSSQETLQRTRDLFAVYKEVRLDGNTDIWVSQIEQSKFMLSRSVVRGLNLNGLPRYVIESALIFGVFAFMSVVLLFSSLAEQALLIGIFLTGGLRLVASLLPLQSASNSFKNSEITGLSAFKILNKISSQAEPDSSRKSKPIFSNNEEPYDLKVSEVSFKYEEDNENLITRISFAVKPGQKYALVGPSGAGKSTVFNLLLGFIKPNKGVINIQGLAPEEVIDTFPGSIGFVPQKPSLVSGTLRSNLTLSLSVDDFDEEEIQRAIHLSGLEEVINNLQFGLDTHLEPDSASLSGGEIQRLGLARALLRRPKILFLDEATSALDAGTEEWINQTLEKLRGFTTVIIIAHRLSTVRDSDELIYLDNGKIAAIGNFQYLIKKVPDFAQAVELMQLGEQNIENYSE